MCGGKYRLLIGQIPLGSLKKDPDKFSRTRQFTLLFPYHSLLTIWGKLKTNYFLHFFWLDFQTTGIDTYHLGNLSIDIPLVIKMRLIKLLLPVIMAGIVVSPVLVQAKQTICAFDEEAASEIKRTVALTNMGIKIEIPANYRAVARTGGSIEFVDNGTYQLFQCIAKNPGAGGRGYIGIKIYKSKTNYLYANVQDTVPGKPNFFIVWEKRQDNDTTFHDLKLRIKTRKGIIEVEQVNDNGPITTEQEANELRTGLIELASIIDTI